MDATDPNRTAAKRRPLRAQIAWAVSLSVFCTCTCSLLAQTGATPDPVASEVRRGDQAYAAGNRMEALHLYESAVVLSHDSCVPCILRVASALNSLEKWSQASSFADKALTLANSDHERGQAHYLKGQSDLQQTAQDAKLLVLAEQEFRAALQLDPSVPIYHFSLGMALLKQSRDAEGVSELQKFLELAPQSPEAPIAREWIAQPARSRGLFAPDFHMTTAQGEDISLATLQGKVAVLDFWATWCPPCRAALPDLKDLVKKYGGSGHFVLISISLDTNADAWRHYIDKNQMTWAQYYDPNRTVFHMFGLEDVPTYVVLGGDGSIIERIVGTDPQRSVAYRLKDVLANRPELSEN